MGVDQTIALAASLGRIRGDVTIVGAAGGTFGMGMYTAPYELNLRSTMWGTRPELSEVLALAALGKITPIVETYSLADVGDGLPAATRRRGARPRRGRAVGGDGVTVFGSAPEGLDIYHVGIVVPSMEEALESYGRLVRVPVDGHLRVDPRT